MFLEKKIMNGQFLPRKNPAKTVKGRGFLDRGLMNANFLSKTIVWQGS